MYKYKSIPRIYDIANKILKKMCYLNVPLKDSFLLRKQVICQCFDFLIYYHNIEEERERDLCLTYKTRRPVVSRDISKHV